MQKNTCRLAVITSLVLVVLTLLAGCATNQGANNAEKRYVVGQQDVEKRFVVGEDAATSRYLVDEKRPSPKVAVAPPVVAEAAGEVIPVDGEMAEEFKKAVSTSDLEKFIATHKPDELAFVAVQKLAKPYLSIKDWQGASSVFTLHRAQFPGMESRFDSIIGMLHAAARNLTVTNLGPDVNTPGEEYHPVLGGQGNMLYFARDIGTLGGENILVSAHDGAKWGTAADMGRPVNTATHEVPLGVSLDGTLLTLFGNYSNSFGRGDIYYAVQEDECWSEVGHYQAPINTEHFDSDAMLPADGKTMLFVSDRPGGVGEMHKKGEFFHGGFGGNTDIYVIVQTETGQTAINLGPVINTPYSEYSPYLSADGKTFYFSSDGHGGLGGLDVFKATRTSDTSWTEWSEPVNLGKDINGPLDDWGYQIATSGKLAYFATNSRIDGYGGNDLYAIEMPVEVRPNPVTTVSGRVLDPDGNPIPGATVVWNDLTLNREIGKSASAPVTGQYLIALPAGHNYGFYADKEGYVGKSENLDLTNKTTFTEYHMDIILHPVEQLDQVVIRLNNIFFDFNKATLKEASILELNRWVKFLGKYTNVKAEFQGHADWIGSDAYNQKLSTLRAQAVVDYLVRQGVTSTRVKGVGFGESRPVASNETEEGRAQNRRVEIHFQTVQP